jgi:hypothetical protein
MKSIAFSLAWLKRECGIELSFSTTPSFCEADPSASDNLVTVERLNQLRTLMSHTQVVNDPFKSWKRSGAQRKFCIKQLTLVVESQLYTAGALVSFDAYTIGKLPNHKGR